MVLCICNQSIPVGSSSRQLTWRACDKIKPLGYMLNRVRLATVVRQANHRTLNTTIGGRCSYLRTRDRSCVIRHDRLGYEQKHSTVFVRRGFASSASSRADNMARTP